jgi:hypothetical protein
MFKEEIASSLQLLTDLICTKLAPNAVFTDDQCNLQRTPETLVEVIPAPLMGARRGDDQQVWSEFLQFLIYLFLHCLIQQIIPSFEIVGPARFSMFTQISRKPWRRKQFRNSDL